MSLEFSSAVLSRHCFNKAVLHSRFWRLTDGSKLLSDSVAPASGDCPAYVTGIVFARHVAVKEKSNTPSTGLGLRCAIDRGGPTGYRDQSDADEIRVLASICTGVPKCPDPDPSPVW